MNIDDIDVFDSMRWLLEHDVDLNDRRAVEKALIIPDDYRRDPEIMDRFIKWCIKAARANPGYVLQDTVVRENCSLHVRGNLLGNLTIEAGATVVVEGSVDGKIVNRGGRLVVNNNTFDGPPPKRKPAASCK